MNRFLLTQAKVSICFALTLSGSLCSAQFQVNFDNLAGDQNYASTGNWQGFLPSAANDEFGVIGSITLSPATANLSSAIGAADNPGRIVLGESAGQQGTLNINAGGALNVVPFASATDGGDMIVGNGGVGILNVTGGTLQAVSLNSGGDVGSGISLSGSASVTAGSSTLGATTTIAGSGVTYDVTDNLTLQGGHTLVAEIVGGTHSKITVGGIANLGGALSANITGAAGSSWDLVDASTITGSFNSVTSTTGTTVGVRIVDNGSGGDLAQLFLDQILSLTVDRNSGAVSINNASSSVTVDIDAYTLTSVAASLNSTSWNSLNDQAQGDWRESPTPPAGAVGRLSELQKTGATTVTDATPLALGAPYSPAAPAQFGDSSAEDIQFQYRRSDGAIVDGTVEYTGATGINNLVLIVDPSTGEAMIKNTSGFDVSIDAYTVTSAESSLSGDNWNSLDDADSAGGDWRESPAPPAGSVDRLSELKQAGSHELLSGDELLLGSPFVTSGEQDLEFTFRLIGDSLAGDFNNDQVVDAIDYAVWREGLGTTFTSAQYDEWLNNYGASGTAATIMDGVVVYQTISPGASALVGVPEPSCLVLIGLMSVMALGLQRKS